MWIGASFNKSEEIWAWSNGIPLDDNNFENTYWLQQEGYDCGMVWTEKFWGTYLCRTFLPYVCMFETKLTGILTVTLEYYPEQITFSFFKVWYHYIFRGQGLLDSWENKRMTGFQLIWFLMDRNGSRVDNNKINIL